MSVNRRGLRAVTRSSSASATMTLGTRVSPTRLPPPLRAGRTIYLRWVPFTISSCRNARQIFKRASQNTSRQASPLQTSSFRREGSMKGDFTRDTFEPGPAEFYRVMIQQGRVQLDADWNEQIAILLRRLE